jgi:hypothetical protein
MFEYFPAGVDGIIAFVSRNRTAVDRLLSWCGAGSVCSTNGDLDFTGNTVCAAAQPVGSVEHPSSRTPVTVARLKRSSCNARTVRSRVSRSGRLFHRKPGVFPIARVGTTGSEALGLGRARFRRAWRSMDFVQLARESSQRIHQKPGVHPIPTDYALARVSASRRFVTNGRSGSVLRPLADMAVRRLLDEVDLRERRNLLPRPVVELRSAFRTGQRSRSEVGNAFAWWPV